MHSAIARPIKTHTSLHTGDAVGGLAEVRVGVSVEPWTYKQPMVPAAYRSLGPHTVVLQVVEGEEAVGAVLQVFLLLDLPFAVCTPS